MFGRLIGMYITFFMPWLGYIKRARIHVTLAVALPAAKAMESRGEELGA